MGVCLATEQGFPYYPNRYFHHQVANWLVENRQKVMLTQKAYLQQAYGIRDPNATFPGPYSYKEYCHHVLNKRFWGYALVHDPSTRNCAVFMSYTCIIFTTNLNSTELYLQGVAPRSQYSDPALEVVTLQ